MVVGTPSAGRQVAGSERVVGFFVNTLALRLRAPAGASVSEYLSQVGRVVRDGLEHEQAPFERVVEALDPVRSLAHTPVFQAMLAWQSQERGGLSLPGVSAEELALSPGEAKFDVTLSLSPAADGGVSGVLEYDADLILMAGVHLGVAHPPGYPLYTLIVHLFTRWPLGDPAVLGHLSSAVAGALACGAVYACARLLRGRRRRRP